MTEEKTETPAVVYAPIPAERVKRDNSNLWRHNRQLDSAVRKERFRKEDFDALREYHEHQGILGSDSPHDSIEIRIDMDNFKNRLSPRDRFIFEHTIENAVLNREPIIQQAVAVTLGISQPLVSVVIKKLKKQFRDFYFVEE